MFNVEPTCKIKIDKKNFKKIFKSELPVYFTGCNPDLNDLRTNRKLNDLAFDSGIYLEEEIILPLENVVFTSVCFEPV
jgi:hypothetical protein